MMTGALFAMAMQIFPAPGALQWELLTDEPEGRMYLAPTTLRRDGDIVRFLTRSDFHQAGPRGWGQSVLRVGIDCRRRLVAVAGGDACTAEGHYLETRGVPVQESPFHPMGRSIYYRQIFARVCGGRTPRGGRR